MAEDLKKKKLTSSTNLEHRIITDVAAVLWQATEVAASVRSSGQMALVDVIHPTSMDTAQIYRPPLDHCVVSKGHQGL